MPYNIRHNRRTHKWELWIRGVLRSEHDTLANAQAAQRAIEAQKHDKRKGKR